MPDRQRECCDARLLSSLLAESVWCARAQSAMRRLVVVVVERGVGFAPSSAGGIRPHRFYASPAPSWIRPHTRRELARACRHRAAARSDASATSARARIGSHVLRSQSIDRVRYRLVTVRGWNSRPLSRSGFAVRRAEIQPVHRLIEHADVPVLRIGVADNQPQSGRLPPQQPHRQRHDPRGRRRDAGRAPRDTTRRSGLAAIRTASRSR